MNENIINLCVLHMIVKGLTLLSLQVLLDFDMMIFKCDVITLSNGIQIVFVHSPITGIHEVHYKMPLGLSKQSTKDIQNRKLRSKCRKNQKHI